MIAPQKTGRLIVINPCNDVDKDKEMVQELLGNVVFFVFLINSIVFLHKQPTSTSIVVLFKIQIYSAVRLK